MIKRALDQLLASRVLVLDGAMGTMLLAHPCTERDVRGDRFETHPTPLRGNVDLLTLTQPALVASIHDQYLAAGADIITTNTFQATALSQEVYGLTAIAAEMALASARLARRVADTWSRATPSRPRLVAGSIGPVPRGTTPPERREEVEGAYRDQALALLEGGVDLLLLETMTSLDEAMRAARGARDACARCGRSRPILVSFSPTTAAADLAGAGTLGVAGLGINCAAVGQALATTIRAFGTQATYVTCHPSAGLPVAGEYALTPNDLALFARGLLAEGVLDVVGGCCGTTPAHTRALADVARAAEPRRRPRKLDR